MKRKELLKYFTLDELRGLLVDSIYDPDDTNLDIDLSFNISQRKRMSSMESEVLQKYFEHIAHQYDKKKCGCMKQWMNALGIKYE